ncbi:hypothetical protein A2U01_0090842, partial [Trifolium medium]|nr:hypothetical protein [Trifolium medium]
TSREPNGMGYDTEAEKVTLEAACVGLVWNQCYFVEGCDRCTVVPRWVLVITG